MRFRLYPALVALFIGMPLLDAATLVLLGRYIGFWTTVALVLFSGFVGAWLAKSQGAQVWRGIREQFSRGEIPTEGLMDGAIVLIAGGLLIAPGFLTDILGMLLLLPPVRTPLKRLARRRMEQELHRRVAVYSSGPVEVIETTARIES